MTSIYSKATVPPVCGAQALEDINIWDCSLYVPFELEYDDWAEDFDVAQINNIHLYDDDLDGEADRTVVEAFTVHSGSLEANYPYQAKHLRSKLRTITTISK